MKKRIFSILLMLLVVFTLVACKKDPKPDEDPIKQKFDEVVETLNGLVSKPDEVKNDLTLPKTFRNGITGEWKTSDDKLLALTVGDTTVAGKVSRPDHDEGNKKVTLSIELVLVEDDKEHTRNWSLELTIIALDPPASTETYTSFKDTYDALIDGEFKLDNFRTGTLEFEGVKLYGTTSSGQYVATSDGTIAYIHGSTPKFEAGKTYDATAKLYDYFGFIQLDDVNISESDEDIEVDVNFAEKSIAEIVKLPLPNVDGHRVYPETWVLKDVKFLIDETMSSDSYNLVIVDKDFDPETAERSEDGDNYYKDSVMAYYVVHDYNQLKALEGTVISELEVIYEGYRDDKHVHYVTVLSIDDHVHLELTDELKVDMAKAALEIDTNFAKDGTLDLPTEGVQGTSITWDYKNAEDDNNDLINLTTGKVTIPAEGREKVFLVATITSGDKETTKEFEIFVGEYVLETIKDALDADNNDRLMVKGVVTGMFANQTYGFSDGTHSIALYTKEKLTVGREYTVVGIKDNINGLHRLKDLEIEDDIAGTLPEPVAIDDILGNNEALKAHIAGRVSIEEAEITKVGKPDENGNVNVEITKDDVTLEVRYNNRVDDKASTDYLKDLVVGTTINYIGHLGWYNGPQLGYGPETHFAPGWPEASDLPTVEGAITIADFLAGYEADDKFTGTIVGVITSMAPYNSFSLTDGTGAVAFRTGKNATNVNDFQVGDVIIVNVKGGLYKGLIQAEPSKSGEYEVKKGFWKVPAPIDLDDVEVSNEFLIENQSHNVVAKDAVVVSATADNFGTPIVVVKIGGKEVTIKYDNRMPVFAPEFLLSLKKDDKVDINNAIITVSNENPLLMIDNPNQVKNDTYDAVMDEAAFVRDVNSFKFELITLTEDTTLNLLDEFKGATVVWSVVEGADHINLETGKVTIPSETKTLKLKAVFTKGTYEEERTYELTLAVPVEGEVHHETFDGHTLTASYEDATFTGVNGTEWVVTHSRNEGLGTSDDYSIDGKGIMLRRGSDSSLSVTFAKGISWFSFDARKAFTGGTTRTLIVTINGVEEEVVINSVGDDVEKVFNFEFNIVGDGPTTIVIKPKTLGNHQTTLDNFKWVE